MRDFTLHTYKLLLTALKDQQYTFQTFADFLKNPQPRAIILRHDVDARKLNSLRTARLENEMGIVGTYNFRMVPQSFDEAVIREIADMGHEIGYHYEELAVKKGNFVEAIGLFEKNLATLRQITRIETICMHGSPLSKYDNRKLWEKYDYRIYHINGEPYFDVDFQEVFYLTDTGRRWDGKHVSLRDKVSNWKLQNQIVKEKARLENYQQIWQSLPSFHSTFDILNQAYNGRLANQIMITIHPQRWENKILPWLLELLIQNLKNIVKAFLAKKNAIQR